MKSSKIGTLVATAVLACMSWSAGFLTAEEIKLTSAGPIAFGPEGLLLVSDPMEATIYAIETGIKEGSTDGVKVEFEDVRQKIASMMGAKAEEVRINDLAIHPINGHPFLSVSRGSGKDEASLILTIDPATNAITEFDLTNATFTKTTLPNPAEPRRTRRGNQRMQATSANRIKAQASRSITERTANSKHALPFEPLLPCTTKKKSTCWQPTPARHWFEFRSGISLPRKRSAAQRLLNLATGIDRSISSSTRKTITTSL